MWGSRVWEKDSLEYFDINVCSSGNKGIQKGSVNMIKDKKKESVMTVDTVGKFHHTDPRQRNGYAHLTPPDNDTKSVRPPDMEMETILAMPFV